MNTQKITRKNLEILHKISCKDWKNRIEEIIKSDIFSDTFNINESEIKKAFEQADDKQKKLLNKFFKISTPIDIVKQIKTFDDILRILGKKLSEVIIHTNPKTKLEKYENAHRKIYLITEVYNQGVELDFTNNNQYKYIPYFKKDSVGVWSVCSCIGYRHVSGAPFGSYYISSELAIDAGKKFVTIYQDWLP